MIKQTDANRGWHRGRFLTTCIVAASFLLTVVAAPAQAETPKIAITPGTFFAKTHDPVPALQPPGANVERRRIADLPGLLAAEPVTRAGDHPDGTTSFKLTATAGVTNPFPKDIYVDLPAGFIGNPRAVTECDRASLIGGSDPRVGLCPPSAQVGLVTLELSGNWDIGTVPLFNVTPAAGRPAAFAFRAAGTVIVLEPRLRSESDYGITVESKNISNNPFAIRSVTITVWGDPAAGTAAGLGNFDDRYDGIAWDWGAPPGIVRRPFWINPSRCDTGPLATRISMRAWYEQERWVPRDLEPGDVSTPDDYVSFSPEPTGCDAMPPMGGELEMRPASGRAGQPSGYNAKLTLPYNDDPDGIAYPTLKKAEVVLPEGVTVSPAAANGLAACTDEQAGFGTESKVDCPDASKIGTVSVKTPLLDETVDGHVYIGSPTADQLLRVFIILQNERRGVTARVAGDVDTDPVTGQVRAVFDDNPQLPFTDMDIHFDSGPLASLVNPDECGRHEIVTTLTGWNGDEKASRSPFVINQGCNESRPFEPWLDADTTNGLSGEYSTFFTRFGRSDADEQIDSIAVELPEGLAAKIAGVPLCPDERADAGTCGPESRVGHVQAASGAGTQPFWVPGAGKDATSVSLAGPYRGAPFSLSIVVPAQAGPFDLGRVVVRTPIWVNPRTAQVSVDVAESRWYDRFGNLAQTLQGRMPTILEGIPLRLKETRVVMDREEFMVNPTNCKLQAVKAKIGAVDGRSADVESPFRATDCSDLGFDPRFSMRILDKGRRSTVRSWNPRTRFTVRPRQGDANMGPSVVTLPSSVILDQSNLDTTCTRAQMAAEDCPAGSVVGFAKAWSPLLDEPVQGRVYLAANGGARPLPDVTAVMDGQVRVELEGWIDTVRRGGRGRLRNRFMVVPDVPVTRFQLTMRGGKRSGLLVNSTDLCRSNERGLARFRSANGKLSVQRPAMQLRFRGCKQVRRKAARRAAKRKAARRRAVRRLAARHPRAAQVRVAGGSRQIEGVRDRR